MLTISQLVLLEKKMTNFKDIMQGQYFVYELFKNNHIQCIKKTTRTALVLLDDTENFIMYFSNNEKVIPKNVFTII